MTRVVALAAVLLALVAPLSAQTGTADQLRRARELYEGLEFERAMPLLRQVISPQWPHAVSNAERVEAYLYLGAALVLAGRADSGVTYFRAALQRDPFSDLDAQRFTPLQLQTFARARRETFALGARPVAVTRVDPRTQRVRFTIVTTHDARVLAQLRRRDSTAVTLLDGTVSGVQEVAWDGLLADGHLAPPGRYEMVIIGRSSTRQQTDSARVFFGLRHEVEPLEDTLPAHAPGELLPERRSGWSAAGELAKGLGVAAGVLAISSALSSSELDAERGPAVVVAGAAALTGVVAMIARAANPVIAENVAANQRRETERRTQNDTIRTRNADRIARTVLLLAPAAGTAP